MSSIAKLLWRFAGVLFLGTIILVLANVLTLLIIVSRQDGGPSPWRVAENVGSALEKTDEGYTLSEEMTALLESQNAWAICIDNETMQVVWQTANLPDTVPRLYNLAGIALLSRGYIGEYPTYPAEAPDGLVVVGFPADSYWKHSHASWDFSLIKYAPVILATFVCVNLGILLCMYIAANIKTLRSIRPFAEGIQALPTEEPVYVKDRGVLSDLANKINRTSELLQMQKRDIRKKEMARANWISGVSHDIRTPLSMIMGYAAQLEERPSLTEEERRMASIIRQQSVRMKNLINDLNLASKLEYNMQPVHPKPVSLTAVARACAAEFLNTSMDERWSVEWRTADTTGPCVIQGDKALLSRAVNNLLNNTRAHNPEGCGIWLEVREGPERFQVIVEDDGFGISDEALEKLRNTPHYMMSDSGTAEPRHGLGLLIVQQIVKAHLGSVEFDHGSEGGFRVTMSFPKGETQERPDKAHE